MLAAMLEIVFHAIGQWLMESVFEGTGWLLLKLYPGNWARPVRASNEACQALGLVFWLVVIGAIVWAALRSD
jgi:hypothetical protein